MNNVVPVVAEEIAEDERDALLDKLARGIVQRRLATPAILLLETCKPLNFVGSQFMLAAHPFVTSFFKGDDYRKVALILEEDASLESLMQRIERLERDRAGEKKPQRARAGGFFARMFGRSAKRDDG